MATMATAIFSDTSILSGATIALPSFPPAAFIPEQLALKQTTIIIVNHNTLKELIPCLNALYKTLGPDDEVIVIDNASSDKSVATIRILFPDLLLIASPSNNGFGSGNNLGSYYANGEYLVFLNPDTIVRENWLEALIAPLQNNPHVGLTTSKILMQYDAEHINTCGNSIHITGLTLCRGANAPASTFDQVEEIDAVSGAAFAIRRELFDQLGGFDEDCFLYMEDTDLSWRAILAGWQILYTPQSIIEHDYTLQIGSKKIFYQERNRYLILLKSFKWLTLLTLLPILVIAECITWVFVLYKDRRNVMNKIYAYEWTITHWRSIMRKRKVVQSQRRISDNALLRHMGFSLGFDQFCKGTLSKTAQFIFDPLFYVLRAATLAIVMW
ncbi:MAG: glycosyltransferase family 2 protein [Chloroflexota bacterium]